MARQEQLRSAISASSDPLKLVCVPARMSTYCSRPIADRWRRETVIFANGACTLDAPSFISVNGWIVSETWVRTNQILIHNIPPWPVDYEFLHKLTHRMSKPVVTRNLAKTGLFVMAYEFLERGVVGSLREHYLAIESDGKRYKLEVESKARKAFDASCIWYLENDVLTESEIEELKAFRKHRNELAHEMPNVLFGLDREIDRTMIYRMAQLMAKLTYWWSFEIKLPADSEGQQVLNLDGVSAGPADSIATLIWYTFEDD